MRDFVSARASVDSSSPLEKPFQHRAETVPEGEGINKYRIAADGWLAHAAWSTPPPPPPMIILIAAPPPGLLEALESYAPDLLIQDGDSDVDAATPIESLQDLPPPTLHPPEPITPDEIAMLLDTPLDPPDGRETTP